MADSFASIAGDRYRQSIEQSSNISMSTIDSLTNEIQTKLCDASIGSALIGKALKYIGEAQIRNIANYASREATSSAGHLFVRICSNEINKRK